MLKEEPLNAVQVASLLHVGRNKVYEMAQSGELPSYRIGRKLLFSQLDVQQFLEMQHGRNVGRLAEAGVASASSARYVEELVQHESEFNIAGTDLVSCLIVDALSSEGFTAANVRVNGYAALVGMYLGNVDAACVDLYDAKTNSYNVAFAQRLAPGVPVVVINLFERKRGFAVAEGNPKKITTWGGLLKDGVRLAQQEPGTAARVLLDEKLMLLEARAETIIGYDGVATNGFLAANRVAKGFADVAICTEHEALSETGVTFLPMQTERLDLVVRKSRGNREFVKAIKRLTASDQLRELLLRLAGADCRNAGSIVYES